MRDAALKLHSIVFVRHDDYAHYGEILSLRTPTDTFMVRMVPGHPGTLQEMSATRLSPTTGRIRWVHYARVLGPRRDRPPHPGSFPVDMLRYDHAAPLNFKLDTLEVDPVFGLDGLVIAKASDRRHAPWTPVRWNSFLWGIEELNTEEINNDNRD